MTGGRKLWYELTFGTVVFIQVDARSIATRTFTVLINVTLRSSIDRLDRFEIILVFLEEPVDKEELKTLENEIADRFFYKYDVQISKDELDNKRANLIKTNDYLK